MQNIKTAKLIAAFGLLGGFILGFIFPLFSLIGMLAFLYGIFLISNALNAKNIFYNMLISIAVTIVGMMISFFMIGGSVVAAMMSGQGFNFASLGFSLFIFYLVILAGAFFYFKSIKELGERLNQPLIQYAAYSHIIGAALTIVLIGPLITFIGLILLIIGLFQAPDEV